MPRLLHPQVSPPPLSCRANINWLEAQRVLHDGLKKVRRGATDIAVTAAVVGVPTCAIAGVGGRALAVAGMATAAAAASVVAQAVQQAFVPDLYLHHAEQLRRATAAWLAGQPDRAIQMLTLANRHDNASGGYTELGHFMLQADLEALIAYALEKKHWAVVSFAAQSLVAGAPVYWDMMIAAHGAGLGRTLPLVPWADRLISGNALSADQLVQLADLLMACAPVQAQRAHGQDSLVDEFFACVAAAQKQKLDRPTLHRLLRLAHRAPQVGYRSIVAAAQQASGMRAFLFGVEDLVQAGKLTAAQEQALFEQVSPLFMGSTAPLDKLQAFAAGRARYDDLCLALAPEQEGPPAAHATLARHALAQFTSGDTSGALATVRRMASYVEYDNTCHRAAAAVFAHMPGRFLQLLHAAMQADDRTATHRLLPFAYKAPPGARLGVLNVLRARALPHEPLRFFADGKLLLRDLSVAQLLLLGSAVVQGFGTLERPEDAALVSILSGYVGPDMAAMLRVWLLAARTPELTTVLTQVRHHPGWSQVNRALAPALARGELTDRGFLLALHCLNSSSQLAFTSPRLQALIHCQPLLKNEQRLRRLLSALAQLAVMQRPEINQQVEKLLLWPHDTQLRSWLADEGLRTRTLHGQALEALRHGTAARAEVRAARDLWAHRVDCQHLHAQHVLAQGNAAETSAYRSALHEDGRALRAHLRSLSAALPTDGAGPGLVQAFFMATGAQAQEQAAKALNAWRKARSKASEADAAAEVYAAMHLCVQRGRIVRQLGKRLPQRNPNSQDFLTAYADDKKVRVLFAQPILSLQIDALHALLSVEAFDGNIACAGPLETLAENARIAQFGADTQPALNALLARFRDKKLFWAFAGRMRSYSAQHKQGFGETMNHLLLGTHTEQRRQSPQMRALFGHADTDTDIDPDTDARRTALRHAWETGAWSEVPAGGPYAGMRLHDTGAFEDFASSGDEITGSCQSVISGVYCQYLLGRVVCGSKRMVTVKDPHGKMLARAMFRLMLDANEAPTLLLSLTYAVGNARRRAAEVLRNFATQRAEALQLPLVSRGQERHTLRVHCKTGTYPEYWDEGGHGNGLDAHVIWAPSVKVPAAAKPLA